MALINFAWFLLKYDITLAEKKPSFLSSSIFNLLEDTNAISIPEKKADDKRETPITIRIYPCMLPKFNLFVDLQYS